MSRFFKIPVEVIKDFRGKTIKTAKLDDNLEIEYKPIECPDAECSFVTTSLDDIRVHLEVHPEELAKSEVNLTPVLVDTSNPHYLLVLLKSLNQEEGPLVKLRKSNDSFNSSEVWKAVWKAFQGEATDIRLHKDQYKWLHSLLDRKVPGSAEKGEDLQTVAMVIFGLSWYQAVQTLLIPSEREDSGEEEETETNIKEVPAS